MKDKELKLKETEASHYHKNQRCYKNLCPRIFFKEFFSPFFLIFLLTISPALWFYA